MFPPIVCCLGRRHMYMAWIGHAAETYSRFAVVRWISSASCFICLSGFIISTTTIVTSQSSLGCAAIGRPLRLERPRKFVASTRGFRRGKTCRQRLRRPCRWRDCRRHEAENVHVNHRKFVIAAAIAAAATMQGGLPLRWRVVVQSVYITPHGVWMTDDDR